MTTAGLIVMNLLVIGLMQGILGKEELLRESGIRHSKCREQ